MIRTHFSPEKIKVVPIGFRTENFSENRLSKNEARKLLGIDPKHPLFGIIGRISEKKGQLFVAESFAQFNKIEPIAELLILGSATINDPSCIAYEQKLKSFIHDEHLNDHIHLMGHRSDVDVFYAAIDCFILASESETYGMVTLEALASKLPVIATRSGGTTEILRNEEFGILFEYNDFAEFEKAVKEFILKPQKAQEKASKGQHFVIDHYGLEKEVQGIKTTIDELINSKS